MITKEQESLLAISEFFEERNEEVDEARALEKEAQKYDDYYIYQAYELDDLYYDLLLDDLYYDLLLLEKIV